MSIATGAIEIGLARMIQLLEQIRELLKMTEEERKALRQQERADRELEKQREAAAREAYVQAAQQAIDSVSVCKKCGSPDFLVVGVNKSFEREANLVNWQYKCRNCGKTDEKTKIAIEQYIREKVLQDKRAEIPYQVTVEWFREGMRAKGRMP